LHEGSLVEESILQLTVWNGAENMVERPKIISSRVMALVIVDERWPVVEIEVKLLLSILLLVSHGEAQY
jgi:hypothetical protein